MNTLVKFHTYGTVHFWLTVTSIDDSLCTLDARQRNVPGEEKWLSTSYTGERWDKKVKHIIIVAQSYQVN